VKRTAPRTGSVRGPCASEVASAGPAQ